MYLSYHSIVVKGKEIIIHLNSIIFLPSLTFKAKIFEKDGANMSFKIFEYYYLIGSCTKKNS